MKINKEEYAEMVGRFTVKTYNYLCIIFSVISCIVGFLANYFLDKDFWLDLIVCVILAVVFYFIARNILLKTAKKQIISSNIEYIEQEINKDNISQVVTNKDSTKVDAKVCYADITKIKEDKYNFYLYLTNRASLIVNKQKLENIDDFKQLLMLAESSYKTNVYRQ